jgi:ribonuclease HII
LYFYITKIATIALRTYYNSNFIEAGLDEAGRGCLAGPVVAAACILPKGYVNHHLADSKQLSQTDITSLAHEIKSVALAYAIGEVSNHKIDQINILNASILAMHIAVDQLIVRPEHLLVDGNRFVPYWGIVHTCIIKGDGKFQSIAAASILAKHHRDTLMLALAHQHPHYGWDTNMGYPTLHHKKMIAQHGLTDLHRLTFDHTIKSTDTDTPIPGLFD